MRDGIPSRATISHNDKKESCDTVSQVVSVVLRHVAENHRILTHDATTSGLHIQSKGTEEASFGFHCPWI